MATQYGHFAFTAPDDGEGYTWNQIVNGPCSGEVWAFTDWKMCRGKSVGFLDWVLDCVERGFSKERYIDPDDNSTNELDARIEQLKKRLKRKKLKPHSFISEEQIQEIERRYGVKLPQEYSLFLSKVGNGFAPADNSSGKFMNPLTEHDLTRISKPFPLENMDGFHPLGSLQKQLLGSMMLQRRRSYGRKAFGMISWIGGTSGMEPAVTFSARWRVTA